MKPVSNDAGLRAVAAASVSAPNASFVLVNSLPKLTVAMEALQFANAFGLDAKKYPGVIDRRTSRPRLSFLTIAGVRLIDVRQGPKPFSPHNFDLIESCLQPVHVFDLHELARKYGHKLSAFLGTILADPDKVVVGVGVKNDLRLLVRDYARLIPCLVEVAWGIQDIGMLRGRSETFNLPRLCSHFLGLRLYVTANSEGNQLSHSGLQHAANRVRLSLMVYVAVGSEGFGAEQRVELGKLPAWQCQVCFRRKILDERPPDECRRIGCQEKWAQLTSAGTKEGSILIPVTAHLGGALTTQWAGARGSGRQILDKNSEETQPREKGARSAKRKAPEKEEQMDPAVKRARPNEKTADEVIDLTQEEVIDLTK